MSRPLAIVVVLAGCFVDSLGEFQGGGGAGANPSGGAAQGAGGVAEGGTSSQGAGFTGGAQSGGGGENSGGENSGGGGAQSGGGGSEGGGGQAPSTCSNGIIDEGEACEDGNTEGGDGCTDCALDDFCDTPGLEALRECTPAPTLCSNECEITNPNFCFFAEPITLVEEVTASCADGPWLPPSANTKGELGACADLIDAPRTKLFRYNVGPYPEGLSVRVDAGPPNMVPFVEVFSGCEANSTLADAPSSCAAAADQPITASRVYPPSTSLFVQVGNDHAGGGCDFTIETRVHRVFETFDAPAPPSSWELGGWTYPDNSVAAPDRAITISGAVESALDMGPFFIGGMTQVTFVGDFQANYENSAVTFDWLDATGASLDILDTQTAEGGGRAVRALDPVPVPEGARYVRVRVDYSSANADFGTFVLHNFRLMETYF